MSGFVGLHVHTEYSLLDGASQIPDLVDRVAELGMEAVALTDHGVMYGAIELMKICKNKGIKPIIGNEMYVINGDITKQEKKRKYHQVVLAKNTQGYKNLVKLTTISHLQGYQGKGIFARPCINKELLEQYKEGLIVTSGCLAGEVPQAILQGYPNIAREVAQWYKERFGEDYYLEIQDHGYPQDRVVNVEIARIARELDIKIVATNDAHFVSCYDVEAHDALLCIQTGKLIEDENRMRYSGTEYIKSEAEMRQLFRDHLSDDIIDAAIANTLEVAAKIESYDIMRDPKAANFDVPEGFSPDTYLEAKAWEGLLDRLGLPARAEVPPHYGDRLRYELSIMNQMGFATYFLIVWDYIKYAKEQGIPVGPGRGSAAGSLVAYALGITNIDPIHHGLLFERFLNPERKSMPDIDTDFCIDHRNQIIEYVTQKYGEDRVAQIVTFNRLTSKAVLKDVGRVLGISYSETDKMAKMIPVMRGKPTKLKVMVSDETPAPEFKERFDQEEKVSQWLNMAMRIEGVNKSSGVHAAGVVIAPMPLDEIVPLQRSNEGAIVTQYPMEDLESLGLLKMDFLGLRNLTTIQHTVELIRKHKKIDFAIEEVADHMDRADSEENTKTYKLLAKGELEGIFQLESSGMKQIVRDLRPSNIEDISSILALYRPGPLDAGLIPKFINRKHGREAMDYAHPLLEPILHDTYSILVYQEQIMRIAQDMAGYSLGEADLLRRAMGKKKPAEMEKQREKFLDGAARNGIKPELANSLFDQMVMFAEYCFNKSHSVAYGYVTYQTAFLKANYPVEYMAALLSSVSGDRDKVQKYIACCASMGIEILPPDVNTSGIDFTPRGEHILFGLAAIKNLGMGAIEAILSARESGGAFTSLADLCQRVDARALNRKALEALIQAGALDSIASNRRQLIVDLDLVLEWASRKAKELASGQLTIFDATNSGGTDHGFEEVPHGEPVPDYPPQERLQLEKELLGFYISDHPLKEVGKSARIVAPVNLAELDDRGQDELVTAIAMISELKLVTTKKGERMAILQLEDLSGSCEAVVFPKVYERIGDRLQQDTRLMAWGKIDRRDERSQMILEDAQPVETVRMVRVTLSREEALDLQKLHQLREVLRGQTSSAEDSTPKVPVVAAIAGTSQLVRFGSQFWVRDDRAAVEALARHGFQSAPDGLLKHGRHP